MTSPRNSHPLPRPNSSPAVDWTEVLAAHREARRTDLSRCVTEEDLLQGYAVVVAATEAA